MEYSFNVEHAKKYGVSEAILIKNFQFWCLNNRANERHLYEGRTWTYNSVKAFAELFPFFTEWQTRATLNSLIKQGVLVTGNFNKHKYDRTLWYAFKDESIFLDTQIHLRNNTNAKVVSLEPIPDNKPDNKPDKDIMREKDKEFNRLWVLYDKKVDKEKAKKLFDRAGKLPDDIEKKIIAYVKSTPEKKYRKNFATWFNNKGWESEIIDRQEKRVKTTEELYG